MTLARNPAVAGAFYPADPATLAHDIHTYLDAAGKARAAAPDAAPVSHDSPPKAVIVPHAGYVYSGAVAAEAYARLEPLKGWVERVVLLGPCHRVPVRGLALTSADAYVTPLGAVAVDHAFDDAMVRLGHTAVYDETHIPEHSLEVQVPFLQEVLGAFKLIPLVVGDASAEDVADVLDAVWGGKETLIVISSDLSHYLPYDDARAIDQQTCHAIETLDGPAIGQGQACGRVPVKGLLEVAKRRGLSVETLDLRNSGDTAGPRNQVVGYGAWAFWERAPGETARDDTAPQDTDRDLEDFESFAAATRALLDEHGALLLGLAKRSIEHALETGRPADVDLSTLPAPLRETGACFVTLKKNGQLRGCIGSPEAHRPLGTDVSENAFRAAFHDPRFAPLRDEETEALNVHISVLSAAKPMTFASEADLLGQLVPGRDGLIIGDGGRRALFLPSVWAQLPEPQMFLNHLRAKAGLPADHWSDTFEAARFVAPETGADWGDIHGRQ